MDLWIRDLRDNSDAQLTEERGARLGPGMVARRQPHRVPDRSPRAARRSICQRDRTRCVVTGRPRSASWDGRRGRPTASRSRSARCFPYSNRYREGLNQLLLYSVEQQRRSRRRCSSRSTPPAIVRTRARLVARRLPHGVRQRRHAVGRRRSTSAAAPPGRPHAIADDQPESPSWEGDSQHIVYQTPRGLRRVLADGSLPDPIALDLDLAQRAQRPSASSSTPATCSTATLEAMRGESDIVIERGIIRSIEAHRDELHTGAVVDASNEYRDARPDRDARASRRRVRRRTSAACGWRTASRACGSRRSTRTPGSSSARRSTPDGGPGRACSSPAIRSTARASTTRAACRSRSDEQLDRELDRASTLGVDFFKTYVRLPDRLQKRIVDYAHAQDRPVTSHELYPGGRVRRRRRRASARHQPARLLAEAERDRPRLPGRHRSDREVGRDADADDRHHGRVSRRAKRATRRCCSIRGWRCFRCRWWRS